MQKPTPVGDESLLDDMRAAVRGDFERARERRESGITPGRPSAIREIRAPLPPSEPELDPGAFEPDAASPEPEPDAPRIGGFFSRLVRR